MQLPFFSDFPCGDSCPAECEIREKMIKLRNSLQPLTADGSSTLVRDFLKTYRELCQSPEARELYPPEIAFPALFDLVMSAKYAERMVADGGWTYCTGPDKSPLREEPALYFPFLKTCPRCSVKHGYRPTVKSNKPSSDTIGEIASSTNLLILSEILKTIAPNVKMGRSTDRQGDVDAIFYDGTMIALIEIKSSPLVIYPLAIKLSQLMTEVYDGVSGPKSNHSAATVSLGIQEVSLYIPNVNLYSPLGEHSTKDWPYSKIADFVRSQQNLITVLTLWKDFYNIYADKGRSRLLGDKRRWLTCGCGGSVDDSKNAPGMDRTDDLKKGSYQVLKFGAYYKEKCSRRKIRSVLTSNLLAVRGFDRYLAEVQDVIWTKDKHSVTLDDNNPELSGLVAFRSENVFNLYDALICLTRSIYRDEHLREVSSLEQFMTKFCS